jgi:hypothetical protein
MANGFSNININKVRQLRPFKIDYSRVRNLEYTDKDNVLPQTFVEYFRLTPPTPIVTEEQARPVFVSDLRYLQSYSALQFPKGKILVQRFPFWTSLTFMYLKPNSYTRHGHKFNFCFLE